jgi:2,4-diaminopentanoate dehydrogenase
MVSVPRTPSAGGEPALGGSAGMSRGGIEKGPDVQLLERFPETVLGHPIRVKPRVAPTILQSIPDTVRRIPDLPPLKVSLYGAGQVCGNVAELLRLRPELDVRGPFDRTRRDDALASGADVVVIGTTSFLHQVADDIRVAVDAGSNVITTAEEAACPWVVDDALATELDALAASRGVSILGAGLNPGFAFDAMVVTLVGAASEATALRVDRVVDLSGFGSTVLRRIGVGYDADEFEAGVRSGTITGHIGFPQSMAVVARALGVEIDAIEREIEPLFADRDLTVRSMSVRTGQSAGFRQRYHAIVAGRPWFDAHFVGHVDPERAGVDTCDVITIEAVPPIKMRIEPGLNAQSSSAAVIANSLRRVVGARPGWRTVAELPPATPR